MIKKALVLAMLAAAPLVWGQTPPGGPTVAGEVLETKDVESYTYLRLKTAQGETWAAVPTTSVKKGAKVSIENPMVMNNFQSKALNKTFDKVVFGTLTGQVPAGADPASPHPAAAKGPDTPDVKVAKATGANARTVAEVLAQGAGMKDKPVLVRGKIVKLTLKEFELLRFLVQNPSRVLSRDQLLDLTRELAVPLRRRVRSRPQMRCVW